MDQENLELFKHLERNKKVWDLWVENGVKEETLLDVDFFFITNSRNAKDKLLQKLTESNVKTVVQENEKSIFFKEYYITITLEKSMWTLDKLNATTIYFYKLGESIDKKLIFDGNGAFIPNDILAKKE